MSLVLCVFAQSSIHFTLYFYKASVVRLFPHFRKPKLTQVIELTFDFVQLTYGFF